HALVHGFGAANADTPFELMLFIRSRRKSDILAGVRGGRRTIALNSVALAKETILACETMREGVEEGSDQALLRNILDAERLRLPTSKPVSNQFEAVYKEARRKNLKLPPESRRRPRARKP